MTKTVDSPLIALFEDRPKQGMVYQLNLSVYLDARVAQVNSLKDFKKLLTGAEKPHLVIVRDSFKGTSITARVAELAVPAGVPLISMGGKEAAGIVVVPGDDNEVKPMLQAAARILGITARQMAGKERDPQVEIAPEFLSMLFTVPCDIFDRTAAGLEKVFNAGDSISRAKVARFVDNRRPLVIESLQRLRLANSVTEQSLKAAAELLGPNVPEEKKMDMLASSLDMVAAQFKSAGMDEETVKLANSSILAIEKIADSATNVGGLLKKLLSSDKGYRYIHSQLLTFLGFHVIKMMGWWGDDQRNIISQAAFYHDISLPDDDAARVHSLEELKAAGITDPQRIETILTHAQAAARELQTVPDISPEVVRVVLQHHGSVQGQGFSEDISKLDNLTKAFLLSEEWAGYIIGLESSGEVPNPNGQIAKLKARYFDDVSIQILETFRYLDPDQFANDFLFPPDPEEIAQVIKVAKGETTPEAEVEAMRKAGDLMTSEEASVVVLPTGEAAELEQTRVKSGKEPAEKLQLVKGGKTEAEGETLVKGAEAEAEASTLVKGSKAEAEGVKLVKGGKAPAAGQSEKKFSADRAKEEASRKAALAAATAGQEAPATKVEGVTEHIEHEKITVKGEAAVEDNSEQTFEGSTEHIEHEKITIKGTKDAELEEIRIKSNPAAQALMDKAVVTFKADAPAEAKELKLKTVAASTELMKAALAGTLDAVTTVISAAQNLGVELRKMDAEGRNALHYAAMGGSLPVLKFLLEKGAQLNAVDSKRRSALFLAAFYRQPEAFQFLLDAGAKINQQALGGMTIAMIGAFTQNMAILRAAIERGVRPEAKDHSGKTALDFAKAAKFAEAIAYLEAIEKDKDKKKAAPVPPAAAS